MRSFLRNTVAALGLFLASVAAISPALALTAPPTFAPRLFQTQQTHYLRFTVNFNSCVFSGLACTVKVGNLPYNAFVVRLYTQTITTWAGATTMNLGLGTNSPATNIASAVNILTAGAGAAATPTIGETNTGNGATATGQDGGFDIFATLTATVALPTAGQTIVVIEYIAPNDGSCTSVPLAATAPAC